MNKSRLPVSLVGFMGSGKSSVGRRLASMTGASFVDLDKRIVLLQGRSIPEIFLDGEEAFRRAEYDALASLLDAPVAEGGLVIALGGGAFTYPASRELILERTRSVYLRTRLETIRARIGDSDRSRPLFKDADRLYGERCSVYEGALYAVDTDSLNPEEVARRIISVAGLL